MTDIAGFQVVDLTHALSEEAPAWAGDPPIRIRRWASLAREGHALRRLSCGEHGGTHLGVAAHLLPDGLTVDRLPAESLVRPTVVVDFRCAASRSPDAVLTADEIERWEEAHEHIQAGWVVLLCTGWSAHWQDPEAYFNHDAAGAMHFPGFSVGAVRFLVEQRRVAGLGIDTAGIDPGHDDTLAANRILLQGNRFHLENLTNLDSLPATGAWLVIGVLPIAGGSGAPARVLALIPPKTT